MISIRFRCYGELNDYLPMSCRQKTLQLNTRPVFVIDLIHSLQIPYSQVELVLANGQAVDFFYTVKSNDRISVYPQFHSIQLASIH
jgi:hypothetical protein